MRNEEDVRKHNEEVDSRKTKSQKQGGGHESDQVGKGFWSGMLFGFDGKICFY